MPAANDRCLFQRTTALIRQELSYFKSDFDQIFFKFVQNESLYIFSLIKTLGSGPKI
mgnify:CR=1 FL=1